MKAFLPSLIGVAVLQSALIGSFGLIKPDLFFLLLFFLALSTEPEAATGIGFALGLVQDALSGAPLGLRAFILSFVGFLASRISLELDTSKPLSRAFLLLTLSLLSGLVTFTLLTFFLSPGPFLPILLRITLPEAFATFFLGLCLLAIPRIRRSLEITL